MINSNFNEHVIFLLSSAKKCFLSELERVKKLINLMKKLQNPDEIGFEYERINYANRILNVPLTHDQMEQRRFITDFCNETYRHYLNKKRNLKLFIKECDKTIQVINSLKNNLVIDRYISVEAHLRIALASVDIYFPDEWFTKVKTGIK